MVQVLPFPLLELVTTFSLATVTSVDFRIPVCIVFVLVTEFSTQYASLSELHEIE